MSTTQVVVTNMTIEQMQARIVELERLQANKGVSGAIKISQKGAVSVYGLGRFPVTLYASQWDNLFERQADIVEFIEKNREHLASKDRAEQAQASV